MVGVRPADTAAAMQLAYKAVWWSGVLRPAVPMLCAPEQRGLVCTIWLCGGSAVSAALRAAAALYATGQLQHRQGCFGWGLYTKDAPQTPGKPWPPAHEVYPWAGSGLHQLDAASPLGALCYVVGAPPDDPTVHAAVAACRAVLGGALLEMWADTPGRTTDEVVHLLQTAAAC